MHLLPRRLIFLLLKRPIPPRHERIQNFPRAGLKCCVRRSARFHQQNGDRVPLRKVAEEPGPVVDLSGSGIGMPENLNGIAEEIEACVVGRLVSGESAERVKDHVADFDLVM